MKLEYNIYALDKFALRISQLRLQKNVSSRSMSLSLGQSEGYINKIENNESYPTMKSFLYICEYLDITPMEFFDFDNKYPKENKMILEEINKLDYKQTKLIIELLKDMNKSRRK